MTATPRLQSGSANLSDEEARSAPYETNPHAYQDGWQVRSGRAWLLWDDAFRKVFKIKPMSVDESLLFCVKQRQYLGQRLAVNGVTVERFDPILELHMNNHRVRQVLDEQSTVIPRARRLLTETNRSLRVLADYICTQEFQQAKVVYGTTLVHRGVQKLGFDVLPISNRFTRRVLTWYLRNILIACNPAARSFIQTRPHLYVPKRVLMSREQFIRNFRYPVSNEV